MIRLFNQRELLTTTSMERQATVRNILADNKIPYRVRVRNNAGGMSRSRMVMPGIQTEYLYQYDIYVKKSDYEKAKYLIQ